MPQTLKVGTILMKMKEWVGVPHCPGLKTEPCFGEWSAVSVPDASALDRAIHAAGWNFFFMATEVKAMYFGFLGEEEDTERVEADPGKSESAALQWS